MSISTITTTMTISIIIIIHHSINRNGTKTHRQQQTEWRQYNPNRAIVIKKTQAQRGYQQIRVWVTWWIECYWWGRTPTRCIYNSKIRITIIIVMLLIRLFLRRSFRKITKIRIVSFIKIIIKEISIVITMEIIVMWSCNKISMIQE